MQTKVNCLLGIMATLVSAASIGKPFPNTLTKVLQERPGTFAGTTYVVLQTEEAVPHIRSGAYVSYEIGNKPFSSLLSGDSGKIGFVVANGMLKEFKDSLPLKVTLNIGVSVAYPNVLKKVLAEKESAIGRAKILTVELEYPVPRISGVSHVSYKIDGKEHQSLVGKATKYQINIGVPSAEVEGVRKNIPLPLEIHNNE
jgi:hypothetical protein